MADKRGDLTVSITVDADEAVTGLKALQRELRKTTQEVREMESAYRELSEVDEGLPLDAVDEIKESFVKKMSERQAEG